MTDPAWGGALDDARRQFVLDAAGWAVFLPGQEVRCPARLHWGQFCAHLVCAWATAVVFVRPFGPVADGPRRIRLAKVRCSNRGGRGVGHGGHVLTVEIDPSATVHEERVSP